MMRKSSRKEASVKVNGGILARDPLVHLDAMKNNHNDGMVTVLEKEEEDDGKTTKKTKMMMA